MKRYRELRGVFARLLIYSGILLGGHLFTSVSAQEPSTGELQVVGIPTPTGKIITPAAAHHAVLQNLEIHDSAGRRELNLNNASALARSPDGRTLAILTDQVGNDGVVRFYVLLFDISNRAPRQIQALPLNSSFKGLAWARDSSSLFSSAGRDDAVQEFVKKGTFFAPGRLFRLGHQSGLGFGRGIVNDPLWGELATKPSAGDIAVSPDGDRLLVSNFQNDSVSLIDLKSGAVVDEQDLRPGLIDPTQHGKAGGSFPRGLAWTSPKRAYVGSERDREIIALNISPAKIEVGRRVPTPGQPTALLGNQAGSRLYVALDNTDQIAIFDTAHDTLVEKLTVVAPPAIYQNDQQLAGVNPNALALTWSGTTLLVSNGGENAIAVIRLGKKARGLANAGGRDNDDEGSDDRSQVAGLVPTGWYPTGVAVSKDGGTWYSINGYGPPKPNIDWCHEVEPVSKLCVLPMSSRHSGWGSKNGSDVLIPTAQLNTQLSVASLLIQPAPAPLELARLTMQVAKNDYFGHPDKTALDERLFQFLKSHIHHVVYIIKENRTYDQLFGDLETGNGDSRLAIFPERISPNHHALARGFVTLDNFLVSGYGSTDGWVWETAGRVNDYTESQNLVSATDNDVQWGVDHNINVGLATSVERHAEFPASPSDPDILPGANDVAAPDGPGNEEGKGYLWDAALRGGLSLRNYGFFEAPHGTVPLVRDSADQKLPVFFPTVPSLMPASDLYYRGWDPAYPDFWRCREWKSEFDRFVAFGSLPNLMLVELGNDHTGRFDQAIDHVDTPETQVADNDYALGLMIEAVANSPFAKDTLIIATEDDSSDGPDHVSAFRSVALFAGPYIRHRTTVSTRYTSVNLLKTIEEILGIGPIGLNDALAAPMSEVFDPSQETWSYKAIVPDVLRSTKLPLPPDEHATIAYPKHSSAYWTKAMGGQDFSGPDRVNPVTFNNALWRGLKGNTPFPNTSKPQASDARRAR